MKIACWSGPRNISTALMRSWSSRSDTFVSDEPFYGHYLKETGLNHPMKEKIINNYPTHYQEIVKNINSTIPNDKTIWYQKHMAHHLTDSISSENLLWIENFKNCILIRHPKDVINSYVKKNSLSNVSELGYPQQLRILQLLQKKKLKFYIIDSDHLLDNPEKELSDWCKYLGIDFDKKMLSWEKGGHKNDGIWGKHWYNNINNSTKFLKKEKVQCDDYRNFKSIYLDSMYYYRKLYHMKA